MEVYLLTRLTGRNYSLANAQGIQDPEQALPLLYL